MDLILALGMPALLILGTLLVVGMSSVHEADREQQAEPRIVYKSIVVTPFADDHAVDEMVARIERHLREEGLAARAFASDPSATTLRAPAERQELL
jgi:hypothetical protein